MANGTPESEFSIECFQNYSAGEVFVQGLAGVVDQTDVETLIRAQKTITFETYTSDDVEPSCSCCGGLLLEPYVECAECEATVCTSCYTTGRETVDHRSDHGYRIRKNDFPIFDNCNWTAKEESKLMSGLSVYGYGNWEEISKLVQTKTDIECEEHYKKYYIDSVQFDELKLLPHTTQSMFPRPLIPFLESEKRTDHSRNQSFCSRNMAGYNAFRSDFGFNYDHNAERMLDVVDDIDYDDELMVALTVSVGNALNTRLKERNRRYNIIKSHGLILSNKMTAWVQQYYDTLGRSIAEGMFPFMQFLKAMQFDALMEQMNLQQELFQKLLSLMEYRRYGIRTLHGAKIYQRLKKSEERCRREMRSLTLIVDNGAPTQICEKTISIKGRSAPRPLEIQDLPGYLSLNYAEKDLCSSLRLLPQKYLEIRDQLISENSKLGFLRLLDARKIVRIDVNKTRKVYDYLVREGYIKKPC